MKRKYLKPELTIQFIRSCDIVTASGDGYANDPWEEDEYEEIL